MTNYNLINFLNKLVISMESEKYVKKMVYAKKEQR